MIFYAVVLTIFAAAGVYSLLTEVLALAPISDASETIETRKLRVEAIKVSLAVAAGLGVLGRPGLGRDA